MKKSAVTLVLQETNHSVFTVNWCEKYVKIFSSIFHFQLIQMTLSYYSVLRTTNFTQSSWARTRLRKFHNISWGVLQLSENKSSLEKRRKSFGCNFVRIVKLKTNPFRNSWLVDHCAKMQCSFSVKCVRCTTFYYYSGPRIHSVLEYKKR